MPRRKETRVPEAIFDQLLAGADPKTVFDGLKVGDACPPYFNIGRDISWITKTFRKRHLIRWNIRDKTCPLPRKPNISHTLIIARI